MAIKSFTGEYLFLNPWYYEDITYNGLTYRCAEAAFQAQKTYLPEKRKAFTTYGAAQARAIGKDYTTLRSHWRDDEVQIMYEVQSAKFRNSPILAKKLIATGDESLYFFNYLHDNWFGLCNCEMCKNRLKKRNILGVILMQIREELKEGKEMSTFTFIDPFTLSE